MTIFTPRDTLKHGDRVRLTGMMWDKMFDHGQEAVVEGSGFEARIWSEAHQDWYYIFDPTVYGAHLIDWSVTRIEDDA